MPDKLTDREIVKALECCSNYESHEQCKKCPFKGGCQMNELEGLALDLINRLQCERNKYRRKVQNQHEELKNLNKVRNCLKAENERLFSDNQKYLSVMLWGNKKDAKNLVNKIKAEAYKEFANELKCRTHEISCNTLQVVTEYDIDNLLKELVDNNG